MKNNKKILNEFKILFKLENNTQISKNELTLNLQNLIKEHFDINEIEFLLNEEPELAGLLKGTEHIKCACLKQYLHMSIRRMFKDADIKWM